MTMKTYWCCSVCGGTNVEQVVHLWQNPNTEEFGEVAEGWNGESYCNDCCDTRMLEPEERELKEPNPYPHYIQIAWGSAGWRESGEGDEDIESYRFESKELLDAFMNGVVEAEGWNGFEILEDSREH